MLKLYFMKVHHAEVHQMKYQVRMHASWTVYNVFILHNTQRYQHIQILNQHKNHCLWPSWVRNIWQSSNQDRPWCLCHPFFFLFSLWSNVPHKLLMLHFCIYCINFETKIRNEQSISFKFSLNVPSKAYL